MHYTQMVGPTRWAGEELSELDWLTLLDGATIGEIHSLSARLAASEKGLDGLVASDFKTILSAPCWEAAKRRLEGRPGFVVLRGLRPSDLTVEEAKVALWGIGTAFGRPRPQNLDGDRIHVVENVENTSPGKTAPGGSTSNNEIIAHTENARPPYPPRLISLMCLRQGEKGGETRLYSGYELYNRVLRDRRDLMRRLHQNFMFGRHDENYPDGKRWDEWPVFSLCDEHLSVRYGRYWINVAERSSGIKMDSLAREAADCIDAILADNRMPVEFKLAPGDILIVDNHTVLHARAAFTDGTSARDRRCLLRLWLD
jgi:alpha-ketoglutarate-dependent taurine dioxygenase